MSEDKKRFLPFLPFNVKNTKLLKIILIIILSVILVYVLFGNLFQTTKSEKELDSVEQYVKNLEDKLKETLSNVDGVGKVSVVISVESGMETVLATKTTTTETVSGKETVETPIIVNGKTVVIKNLYPKIVGVLIVAKGGDDIFVMKKIQQATTSLLNININQIEILAMK